MVHSLNRALTRGTTRAGKSSGMDPLSAGLNRVEESPMQNSMAASPIQFSMTSPQAPASMAASSSSFAPITRFFLG